MFNVRVIDNHNGVIIATIQLGRSHFLLVRHFSFENVHSVPVPYTQVYIQKHDDMRFSHV
jgi:uncharacterized Fe-S cluster-containing protein